MKSLMVMGLMMVAASATALPVDEWHTYRNDTYGYEIRYPEPYEADVTRPGNERDGKIIRIAMKRITRQHGIVLEIHPDLSLQRIMEQMGPRMMAPGLEEIERGDVAVDTELSRILWQSTTVNGAPAVKMEASFVQNGELHMSQLFMDQAVMTVDFWPFAGFDEELAERIVSTFRWTAGTQGSPGADADQ